MNIFFVTDNKRWIDILVNWKKRSNHNVDIFCSKGSEGLLSDEISTGLISVISLHQEKYTLAENYSVGISCHCKQIFPSCIVDSISCFNFHPGLNPYNRGWFPQVFSILKNMPIGATLHKMDSDIDTGPIVDQKIITIHDWDTSETVYEKVIKAEFELFDSWIDKIIAGNYTSFFPFDIGNYNSKQDFEKLLELDLDRPATYREVINHLRALTFNGYNNAFFKTQDDNKVYISINLEHEKSVK